MHDRKSIKNLPVQNKRIRLNGTLFTVKPHDYDGDGVSGRDVVETLDANPIGDNALQGIVQPTELGESLKELNEDNYDVTTRLSGIDMRSRLHYLQIPAMATFDSLIAMKFLPMSCSPITRQLKRLAVSLKGEGRREIVGIVGGNREHEEKKGAGGLWGNLKDQVQGK